MHLVTLLIQGYSSNSKDRKGNFLDDWDLSEAGGGEVSEVNSSLVLPFFLHFISFCRAVFKRNKVSFIQQLERDAVCLNCCFLLG